MTRVLRSIEQYRQRRAVIRVLDADGQPCAGVRIWAEQETHDFEFGVVLPDFTAFSDADRQSCLERANETFNVLLLASEPMIGESGVVLVDFSHQDPQHLPLGRMGPLLDQKSATGKKLTVLLTGHIAWISQAAAESDAERDVAHRLASVCTVCFAHPSVRRIVWKGLTDREPSVAGNGLLRDDLSPKPAFQVLRKLIGLVWHSRASGQTDEQGRFEFQGFLGTYRVVASGRSAHRQIAHLKLTSNSDENHYRLSGMLLEPLQNR